MPTDTEQRVLDALDRILERGDLLDALRAFIAIPSVGGAETPAQVFMADLMRGIGLEVETWTFETSSLDGHRAYATSIRRESPIGVVGSLGANDGPSLILNGHVDVVPAGDPARWTDSPWTAMVRDGRVYGRGAVDMKGSLLCAAFAAKAIVDAGVGLRGRLDIQSVVGEEDGGVGTLATILHHRARSDMPMADRAIVLEPTNLAIAPAQAGALVFRVTVPGRAAHGALREEGVDPIEGFVTLRRALLDLERRRNAPPHHPLYEGEALPWALAIGTLHAGEWDSSVPESLTFEGRIGIAIDETPEAVIEAFEEAVRDASKADAWLRDHAPIVEWVGPRFRSASIPGDDPIVETLAKAAFDATNTTPAIRGMRYGADMQLLIHEAGVPTVLFGPGDIRQAHAPDEFVAIAALEEACRTLALTILRWCLTDE